MTPVPITFDFRGIHYVGHFSKVLGAGSTSRFHLSVDNYHIGQLWYSDKGWRFESNSTPEMRELAEFFGDYITAWYDSLPGPQAL